MHRGIAQRGGRVAQAENLSLEFALDMELQTMLLVLLITSACVSAQEPAPTPAPAPAEKKPAVAGVPDEVKIPIEKLVPDAVFDVPGVPDWLAVEEEVWVSNGPKNTVGRLDPKTNTVLAHVAVGKEPCSGLAVGFGSLWVPCCGDASLVRVDLKTGEVTATLPIGVADSEGGIATGAGSVWLMTDAKGTLARIDPATNKIVAEIHVAPGSFAVAFGDDAVWITSTEKNLLTCVTPKNNLVYSTTEVGKAPRFLAVGEGSVWTLNQGDGTISRVDIKTTKVVATIEAGLKGGGGEIAVGEGSVWVTLFKFPITRIDPLTNKVAQQFTGPGGDSIRVGHGSVWLSNLRAHNVWRLDPKRIEATRRD
jgi:YVTN family beta-propeller protein